MKKFLQKIFLFLLPIFLLALPLDYFISHYLSKSKRFIGEYEVWEDIYKERANCDIAIYGSSRAWVHINSKIIQDSLGKSAYNFGIDGHNFWIQYLRHKELLKYNQKPESIILSVDIFTLQKRADLYNSDQFLPYMLWNKNVKEYTDSFIGFKNVDYYIPLIRYVGKQIAIKTSIFMLLNSNDEELVRNKGFMGMEREWNSDFDQAKSELESYRVELDSASIDLFESFIQECKQEGIDLMLVYTPEYIEGQKFVSNRSEVIAIFNDLSTKYNLPFFDYSNSEISFDKNLFYNSLHLNKAGADKFTKKLANDIFKHNAE